MRSQVFLRDEQKPRVVMRVSEQKRVIKKSKVKPLITPDAVQPESDKSDTVEAGRMETGIDFLAKATDDAEALLFRGAVEFDALRLDYELELSELRMKAGTSVFNARLKELERRQLTPAWIEAALKYRRNQAHVHLLEVAEELHLPPEKVTSEVELKRIHDNVLQLFRVLHRRRIAVLRGEQLPRLNSVFSKVKCFE